MPGLRVREERIRRLPGWWGQHLRYCGRQVLCLPGRLRSNPHLWSWGSNNEEKKNAVNTGSQKSFLSRLGGLSLTDEGASWGGSGMFIWEETLGPLRCTGEIRSPDWPGNTSGFPLRSCWKWFRGGTLGLLSLWGCYTHDPDPDDDEGK